MGLIPAVSTIVIGAPAMVISADMVSRVVPAVLFTMLLSAQSSLLDSVDLPTFGAPAITTLIQLE